MSTRLQFDLRPSHAAFLACLCFAAISCLAAESPEQQRKKAMAKLQKAQRDLLEKLRHSARSSLKDPESAKFSEERLYNGEDRDVVSLCGYVNSRNSYGGYSGKQAFIVTTSGLVMFQEEQPRSFGYVWDVWCIQPISPATP